MVIVVGTADTVAKGSTSCGVAISGVFDDCSSTAMIVFSSGCCAPVCTTQDHAAVSSGATIAAMLIRTAC